MKPLRILSRRSLIRVVCYVTAAFFATVCIALSGYSLAASYRRTIENNYTQSLDDLGYYATNISVNLTKGIYCGTQAQFLTVANQISTDAAEAKSNLGRLPQSGIDLTKCYKFLTQVGDYSLMLTQKLARGESIGQDEWDNLRMFSGYADGMAEEIEVIRSIVMDEDFINGQVRRAMKEENLGEEQVQEDPEQSSVPQDDPSHVRTVGDGFDAMEDGFNGYPSLVYDGPFSDHLLTKKPAMTEGQEEISEDEAREIAAKVLKKHAGGLGESISENSNLPSFYFTADGCTISVTKQGGLPVYMTNDRMIGGASVGAEDAVKNALAYLESIGYGNMRETYFLTSENVCTINFAYFQDGTVIYSDLIKVDVALDNGVVCGFDARGFIMNHREREIEKPVLDEDEGLLSVSPLLSIEGVKLAVIPSASGGEIHCFEYSCRGQEGEFMLVYINVVNGVEEQILILLESENGTLAI